MIADANFLYFKVKQIVKPKSGVPKSQSQDQKDLGRHNNHTDHHPTDNSSKKVLIVKKWPSFVLN